jgi:dihydrofolate reductase
MEWGRRDLRRGLLTHRPPEHSTDRRITFTSGLIEDAVAAAQAAAGDKDVGIFGASVSGQCLQAGLLDEIVLHVAPVLLGDGVRLFGGDGAGRIELERISVGSEEQLTDLRFRILRPRPA